jgi:hypothetical protein
MRNKGIDCCIMKSASKLAESGGRHTDTGVFIIIKPLPEWFAKRLDGSRIELYIGLGAYHSNSRCHIAEKRHDDFID